MIKFINWLKTLFSPPKLAVENKNNPKYIEFSNDYIAPVPGKADDTWLYCFPIKGQYDKMQALINQRLNFSSLNENVRFFPISEYMMLVVSDIRKGYSINPSDTKYGYLTEKALQIFIPIVECTKNQQNEWVAQRILVHIPYIFVDQPFNIGTGREEFGFPKSFANVTMPSNPEQSDNFKVDAYGFKNFSQEHPEYGAFHTLLEIKTTNSAIPKGKWTSHKEAWQHIKQFVPKSQEHFKWGVPFILHELNDVLDKALPMIFLKQFRDIQIPTNACYQAITEGNGSVNDFLGGWLLSSEYELVIQDLASFPLAADLGLESKIKVRHAFWTHCNMQFNTGNIIWKS